MRMTVLAHFWDVTGRVWDVTELRQVYSLSKEVDPDALIEMDRAAEKLASAL